jgi:uncharacterized protein (DUF983 family)
MYGQKVILYGYAVPIKECPTMKARETGPFASALLRGFTMRCPHCGQGKLFERFLKVTDHCAACGEEYSHHRADDFPAYLVIFVVGHITVPALVAVEIAFWPPMWLQYLIWLPFIAFSALALLQPTKGAVVALQWHLGMHGFEASRKRRDLQALQDERADENITAPPLALQKQ